MWLLEHAYRRVAMVSSRQTASQYGARSSVPSRVPPLPRLQRLRDVRRDVHFFSRIRQVQWDPTLRPPSRSRLGQRPLRRLQVGKAERSNPSSRSVFFLQYKCFQTQTKLSSWVTGARLGFGLGFGLGLGLVLGVGIELGLGLGLGLRHALGLALSRLRECRSTGADRAAIDEMWSRQHDWGGRELYNLAVDLRGYHLKGAQWLGSWAQRDSNWIPAFRSGVRL